ncbi:acetylornithine deacetylase/succinyl-diaminopimelate desuccinylase-like protein [Paraburkholderia sp. Clong3]|uniref:M20 family metallopeptidase n=1 Tax=unclassified Paraburkholderia TaxID=2615204 RepID=UPI001622C4A1|nr:M20 family metallopeptidase [Paraburkholderia sp. CI2]MBB5470950.1 acetylornithine deacetylase/succinyl-diaminopimelate desuccinylase-like protein [Paraburkholderia sp. CI2]
MNETGDRQAAISLAEQIFDSGDFLRDLERRVGYRTESQNPARAPALLSYLAEEIAPVLQRLGFETRCVRNPSDVDAPMLLASRWESDALPTVVTYAHGDVVRGYDAQWRSGLEPWRIVVEGDRWYGRGIADNKGQHSVNLAALAAVIEARKGKLRYNVKMIFETGEEIDSPGLDALCSAERHSLAGDLFIASDGPRVSAERPTVFLGSRGELNFELTVALREGGHHSGNWGGVLRNPATVLASAISSIVDNNGRLLVTELLPPPIPDAVRNAIADIQIGKDSSAPSIDPTWGQPDLTIAERVLAWNTIEVLAFTAGNPEAPVGAIPPTAKAYCQMRFVIGTDWENAEQHLSNRLAKCGIMDVQVKVTSVTKATRLDVTHPWVSWAMTSIERTCGKRPALIPNLGGTVPNAVFAETLGLPTIWIPHSYPACSQHAPNEHLLASVAREALAVMAGVWWDLGEGAAASIASTIKR